MRSKDGFKDPRTLTTVLIAFSALTALSGLLLTFGMWLHPLPDAAEDWDALHLLIGLASFPYLAGFAVCIVLGLYWTFRVAWNARHIGAKGFDVSPAMSVGWYFIPFANLVKPYQAMRQVYSASLDPASWNDDTRPLVATWWTLLIGSGLLGRLSRWVDGSTSASINWLDLTSMVLLALAAAAFVVMARRIACAQSMHSPMLETTLPAMAATSA